MTRRHTAPIIATFVLSLVITIGLLVVWVVYIVRSVSRIQELAGRVGVSSANPHWIVLGIGAALFFLLIVGLSYQLALTLAARRASMKQEIFVSNVTHELKSPVAAIKLHAQTLQQSGLTAAERSRSIDYILEQADRVSSLVDDVLESSRLLSRKTRLSLEPVELEAFFRAYFVKAAPRVENEGMALATEVATKGVVLATGEALRQVMNNLLDNAIAYSHRGGEVRFRVHDDGSEAIIEVEDDGIGIPKGELTKIFDRFYQIGRELRGRKGTGLGLSIVSGLVAEMGGSVQAFSHEGRPGARFVIQLPLSAE